MGKNGVSFNYKNLLFLKSDTLSCGIIIFYQYFWKIICSGKFPIKIYIDGFNKLANLNIKKDGK
jgi:hypothetical protein